MPFNWVFFIRIIAAILKIIESLPADADVRGIAQATNEAIEVAVNGGGAPS